MELTNDALKASPLFGDQSRLWDVVFDLVSLGLILAALTVALRTTSGLTAPNDPDHFRDVAQAQTARDGHPLSDQYYRGEWAWYNPLLPWVLALGSALTHTEIETFHAQAGPWLNLLGPLAFYLLAVRLAGRRAALVALALYLFFILGNEYSWAYATYSPRLFANSFAEGLFFSTALALLWTAEHPRTTRALVAGALLGLTFLAHTAPALLLVITACALFATRWRVLLTAGLAAFVVASPFLYAIGVHYHFHVLNPAPVVLGYEPITRRGLLRTLQDNELLIAAGVAGIVIVRSRFLSAWAIGAVAFVLYAVAPVPPLVPAFHFWLYVTAALAILAGSAFAWLCPRPAGAILVTVALVVWNWSTYVDRADFRVTRAGSQSRSADQVAAARFLREVTKPDDVVLGTYGAANLIIGPAGRKVIAPAPVFANPYVAIGSRVADRERMLTAINEGDRETLMTLARRYEVATVVSVGRRECSAAVEMLSLERRFGDVCVSKLAE